MLSKKGFTLIELLAVIVILAIIALISVPIMLNVIEKSRIGAAKSSALGYIDAVEKQIAINLLDKEKENIIDGTYIDVKILKNTYGVNIKGDLPDNISILIEEGKVKIGELCINNYPIKYENGKAEYIKEEKYCEKPKILYKESKLNGTDPVISENLIPIIIENDGKVKKADIYSEWYNYEQKRWANAVILKDESIKYESDEEIPESNIESYFVWIPRYKYKIFNEGNYSSLTTIESKEQVIDIVFENKETTPSNGTKVDEYLTHPAFTSFESNGMWVGKFETGYDGATSTAGAQVNSVNTDKIIIKPNVYSWQNMTIGNMFKNSYDYMRNLDSHMMKNTEWGAVAYLQHSKYGSATNVRLNNNSASITGYAATEEPTKGYYASSIAGNRFQSTALGVDGTYTINYLNPNSVVASTTGNYTGIYDMSGGSQEYVMGYTAGSSLAGGSSGITSLYSDFFNDSNFTKYWDKYTSTTATQYNNRILGDATGELGPFGSQKDPDGTTRGKSSWYTGYSYFVASSYPWPVRGGYFRQGVSAGIFGFSYHTGGANANFSFRIVLTP